jgi:hypothetical protein
MDVSSSLGVNVSFGNYVDHLLIRSSVLLGALCNILLSTRRCELGLIGVGDVSDMVEMRHRWERKEGWCVETRVVLHGNEGHRIMPIF